MIRVGCTADSHFDERDELLDNVRVHNTMLAQMDEAKVDLILHAGDIHNRKSSPEVRLAVAEFLQGACAIAPVVLVRGNHDVPGDILIYQKLRTDHALYVTERAKSLLIPVGDKQVLVHTLPWFDKGSIAAGMDRPDLTSAAAVAAANTILQTFTPDENVLSIGLSHIELAGSALSSGQTLIGRGVQLPPSALGGCGLMFWCCGHIHKYQSFPERVFYPGSPQRNNFGEPETKGWVLVHYENDSASLQFNELPARTIARIEEDWTTPEARAKLAAGQIPFESDLDFDGARVRLRYRIHPDDMHLVKDTDVKYSLALGKPGSIQIEAQVAQPDRIRSEKIGDATSTWEQMEEWLKSAGKEYDTERLQQKLSTLEVAL